MSSRQRAESTPWRVVSAVLLAVVVTMVMGAGRVGAQTEPSVPELIVPGDTTATTVPAADGGGADLAPADGSESNDELTPAASGDDGLAASTKVWIITGGLVAIALFVLVLTILYWRRTKPQAVAERAAAEAAVQSTPDGSGDFDWAQSAAPAPVSPEPEPEARPTPTPTPAPAPSPAPTPVPPAGAGSPAPQPSPEPGPVETPRPVGDTPLDPRRSIFAPPLGDEGPGPGPGAPGSAPPPAAG